MELVQGPNCRAEPTYAKSLTLNRRLWGKANPNLILAYFMEVVETFKSLIKPRQTFARCFRYFTVRFGDLCVEHCKVATC